MDCLRGGLDQLLVLTEVYPPSCDIRRGTQIHWVLVFGLVG